MHSVLSNEDNFIAVSRFEIFVRQLKILLRQSFVFLQNSRQFSSLSIICFLMILVRQLPCRCSYGLNFICFHMLFV